MKNKKLVIVCTVPLTFTAILKDQISYLANYFEIIIISSEKKELENFAKQQNVQYKFIKMKREISPFIDLLSLLKLIKFFLIEKPDIVHSYTPKAGLLSMAAAWLAKTPTRVHTFTGLIFPSRKGLLRAILILMDRLICTCATDVIPEGTGVKKDLINFKITKKELNLIGNGNIAGVDINYFSKKADFKKINKNEVFTFIYVGRISTEKGIEDLIDASNLVSKNLKFQVILLGRIEKIKETKLEELKNDCKFIIKGHIDDIRPYLDISDALILPSHREGFPNVLLQAAAMELPLLVTDVNGSNEIVATNENGWVFKTANPIEMSISMSEIITKEKIVLVEMGLKNRALVSQKYEKFVYQKKLVEFYKKANS